jgi:M6 family metalloprotease-like protein
MRRSWSALALGALVFLPAVASGQDRMHRQWEIPGLDFAPDGVWRVRAREVARRRAILLRAGDFAALNSPLAGGAASSMAVTGTLQPVVVMFRYLNTDPSQYSRDTTQYNATLFGSTPPPGLPYTVRTFYEQMSTIGGGAPLFSIQGRSFGWVALQQNEVNYTGGSCPGSPTGFCNGIFSQAAFNAMQAGMREAVAKLDTGVGGLDFGLFDNDGLDGVPNSGDDDGFIDVVMFLHPTRDGACGGSGNSHIWSHRSTVNFTTNDAWTGHGGEFIKTRDYVVQSGLGGTSTGCDTTQIMAIGTTSHELGHALALPDLYDVSGQTEGIGQWGLMGSGNYTTQASPARYEAWSLQQMGWVTVAPITTAGTYSFGAAGTADTTFLIRVQGANPRGEYFLLENRQRVHSDSAMIRFHCQESGVAATCPGGLLIWHVDSIKACLLTVCGGNVNAGSIHGVALQQADGLANLDSSFFSSFNNRGDAGDPYPGTSNNTVYGVNTNPAARKNSDNSPAGFAIDSIRQLVVNGEMAFRVRIGGLTVVRASPDTNAMVQVDGANYRVFQDIFAGGSTHTISVADTQFTNSNRTRHAFGSWSDGGARTHTISGSTSDTTITVTLNRAFKLIATAGTSGSISSNPGSLDLTNGVFRDEGASVELTATANPTFVFNGWTGDTITSNATVIVPMGRPYTLAATFVGQLTITKATVLRAGVMGAQYRDTLTATGGTLPYAWTVISGSMPPGVVLSSSGVLSSSELNQTGTFNFTAQVVGGAQTQSQAFSITVGAPTLVTQTVVNHVLEPALGTLTFAEQRYLDLLGNQNGGVDVGDFLAWVNATGAPITSAMLQAMRSKGGRP